VPEDYDRCVVVGRRHVCRRCLVLYPVALATMVVVLAGRWEASPVVAWALVLLPLPAVADFVVEHLGRAAPSPRRLVAVTLPLGVGLGAGLSRYVTRPGDPLFWTVVAVDTGVCLAALLTGRRWARAAEEERGPAT
jgi:hypothetical protein